jgi:quercetin dioxygenase-like cupin family protein
MVCSLGSVLVFLALCSGCHNGSQAVTPAPNQIRRTLLSKQDVPGMPDWEIRLFLIEYPPGAVAPRHVHPALGVGYVLEGRCESAFEGDTPVVTEQGHSFVERNDAVHVLFRNPDTAHPLRFVIAFTIRKGEQPVRVL